MPGDTPTSDWPPQPYRPQRPGSSQGSPGRRMGTTLEPPPVRPAYPPRPRQPSERHRPRRRWTRVLLGTLIILVALAVLLAGGGYVYLRHRIGQINRVSIPELAAEAPGEPMNVLLVGSDTRDTAQGDIAEATGKGATGTSGQRSDTIMVLHIDPRTARAAILSIPRDLWVEISGEGYHDRVNTAYAIGGAALLVRTIQDNLGIDIHHYVEVDFQGFSRIVDTVGGVAVYFASPARDFNTGLDIAAAGCAQLDGYQALALVRSRYYESYEYGRWVSDASSDFGRISRQQDFVRRMLRKAVSAGFSNPITLNRLIGIGVNNVTIDASMSTKDITNLARRFRNLDPDQVDMFTLPATGFTSAGGASVLRLNRAEAQPLLDRINGVAEPAPVRPSETRVRVLNGNGVDGAATTTALALEGVGFTIANKGDADSFGYARTHISYAPSQRDKAQLLTSYLVAGAVLEESRSLAEGTVDVVLTIGADYAGVRPGPAGPDVVGGSTTTVAQPTGTPRPAAGAGAPSC